MAYGGRGQLSVHAEFAKAEKWSSHGHYAVVAVFWKDGWGVVTEISNDGLGLDGVPIYVPLSSAVGILMAWGGLNMTVHIDDRKPRPRICGGPVLTQRCSLCFAGKARRSVACVHCLNDGHRSDACLDNPARACFPMMPMSGISPAAPVVPGRSVQRSVCHLFNARNGPRCTFNLCKFAHVGVNCRGNHSRSTCPKGQESSEDSGQMGGMVGRSSV